MHIHKNDTATAHYAKAEDASIVAGFALDMLASAHRTGMDTMSIEYESLRANAIARINEAAEAMDNVGKPEAETEYLDRYNEIMDM